MRAVVIGGGVVGTATAMQLARRGAQVTLLERLPALALQASGTSSGILHTGFDSAPGELETGLILRAARIRGELMASLGVPVMECGAILEPDGEEQRAAVDALERNARENGVEVARAQDGALEIPGEYVTDPVACTYAWAAAAAGAGAEILLCTAAEEVRPAGDGIEVQTPRGALEAELAVNCAGLEGGRLAGGRFGVYPRKGEFLVFDQPSERVTRVRLAVPEAGTKGVLVFPTLDGRVGAGPTAVDGEDPGDWSVTEEGEALVRERLRERASPLADAPAVFRYAGLRPAGRGCNYVIEPSPQVAGLIDVGAIRSTGLSASAAIGEYVCRLAGEMGLALGDPEPVRAGPVPGPAPRAQWWRRTADFEAGEPL